MNKRIRYINKVAGRSARLAGCQVPSIGEPDAYTLDGSYVEFQLMHPSTGMASRCLICAHESGDVIVAGPSFAFRTMSRLLGSGADDPHERIKRLVNHFFLQEEVNKDYLAQAEKIR